MPNYIPEFSGYSGQGAFRYWCQKVLPLVYDDSLSYYELLNKIVVYLNNTIEDVAKAEGNIDSLLTVYTQLNEYVDNYFKSENMQDELETVLDNMITEGTLSKILQPYILSATQKTLQQLQIKGSNLVDPTLTFRGAAADAYVTGRIISNNNDRIRNLQEQINALNPGEIKNTVEDWLENHPEYMTTVENNSITLNKLSSNLIEEIGFTCYISNILTSNEPLDSAYGSINASEINTVLADTRYKNYIFDIPVYISNTLTVTRSDINIYFKNDAYIKFNINGNSQYKTVFAIGNDDYTEIPVREDTDFKMYDSYLYIDLPYNENFPLDVGDNVLVAGTFNILDITNNDLVDYCCGVSTGSNEPAYSGLITRVERYEENTGLVVLADCLPWYNEGTCRLYKINVIQNVNIYNMRIYDVGVDTSTATNDYLNSPSVVLYNGYNCKIDGGLLIGYGNQIILNHCNLCEIRDLTIKTELYSNYSNTVNVTSNANIKMSGCQNCLLENLLLYGGSQSIDFTYNNFSDTNKNTFTYKNTVKNCIIFSTTNTLTLHPGSIYNVITDVLGISLSPTLHNGQVTAYSNGISIRGIYNTVKSCRLICEADIITNVATVYAISIHDGYIKGNKVINNYFENYPVGVNISDIQSADFINSGETNEHGYPIFIVNNAVGKRIGNFQDNLNIDISENVITNCFYPLDISVHDDGISYPDYATRPEKIIKLNLNFADNIINSNLNSGTSTRGFVLGGFGCFAFIRVRTDKYASYTTSGAPSYSHTDDSYPNILNTFKCI